MRVNVVSWSWLLIGASMLFSGCPDKSSNYYSQKPDEKAGESQESTLRPLEEFTPPTLEELNSQVTWEDQRVLDMQEVYAQKQAELPKLENDAAALKLRNTSNEANDKILGQLGRMYASPAEVNYEAELNRHIPSDIKSTNPLLQSSTYEVDVMGLTSLGFFTFDWKMEPYAPKETVVSWQTSADKLFDKVQIRDDLVWSDGTPVTAHDVVFTFRDVIRHPKVILPAIQTGMDEIRAIHAYDDHTFVVFHEKSLSTNIWNINFPILPKHIYEGKIDEDPTLSEKPHFLKYEANPICGGPYKIVKHDKGQEVIVERREDWYMHDGQQVRPKPHFKRIRFRVIEDSNTATLALNRGDVEDMEMQPVQWVEHTVDDEFYARNTKVRGVQWVYYYFGWNIATPQFEDKRVRHAMSYLVDYDYIMGTLCYGLYPPCTGQFHPDSWAGPVEPRTPYKQDFDKAIELLKAAGWNDSDGDGIRDKMINGKKVDFSFSVMCANDPLRVDICSSLKESLDRVGIKCIVSPTEFTTFQEKARNHAFQAMFGGWGTGTDPSTNENLWKTGEPRNYCQFSNERVDELFDLAKNELDQDKRAKYYREIDDILWEEQPYTYMYYRSAFYAFNKRLRGYSFSPRGPYHFGPGFDAIWPAAE